MSAKIVVATLYATRPNTSVDFIPQEIVGKGFADFVKENYIDTGKILSRTESRSPDNLTLILTTTWISDEERKAYSETTTVKDHFEKILNFRKANGITTTFNNKEYDGDTLVREWSGTL